MALDVADLQFVAEGVRLRITRSKMDQEARGEVVGVVRTGSETCLAVALQAWLAAARVDAGRIFRSVDRHGRVGLRLTDQSVALVVKERAARIGLGASAFSGHSLREGLATAAAQASVEKRITMRQTRHRSVRVFHAYQRDGELFADNVSGRVGL